MNKMLIVLLAVCLVSTQAFVKREAIPADGKNYLENLQKQIQEFGNSVNTQVANAFDTERIKKNVNEFVDGITKTHDSRSKLGSKLFHYNGVIGGSAYISQTMNDMKAAQTKA